jgi:hypothetical protein
MEGRNAINGRFASGWKGGGRKPISEPALRAQYLDELTKTVPLTKWQEICNVAVAQALEGDGRAREFLANYLVGRPLQAVEVSGPGGSPIAWGVVLMAIRQAVPDAQTRDKISAALDQLSRPQQALNGPDDSDDS